MHASSLTKVILILGKKYVGVWWTTIVSTSNVQVNLFQKLLFLFFVVFVLTFRTIYAHNMFSPCSELVVFMYWTGKSMNNLLTYCGLVDPRISASDKDLPVIYEWSLTGLASLSRNMNLIGSLCLLSMISLITAYLFLSHGNM